MLSTAAPSWSCVGGSTIKVSRKLTGSQPEVISYKEMVDKIDPILLLIGSQPEQKIRQICQEEMVRYGVIDSYSVSSNRRNGRG